MLLMSDVVAGGHYLISGRRCNDTTVLTVALCIPVSSNLIDINRAIFVGVRGV